MAYRAGPFLIAYATYNRESLTRIAYMHNDANPHASEFSPTQYDVDSFMHSWFSISANLKCRGYSVNCQWQSHESGLQRQCQAVHLHLQTVSTSARAHTCTCTSTVEPLYNGHVGARFVGYKEVSFLERFVLECICNQCKYY